MQVLSLAATLLASISSRALKHWIYHLRLKEESPTYLHKARELLILPMVSFLVGFVAFVVCSITSL